ncbi:MAG: hypothetical protein K0R67_2692 [Paenibacillus sp.]|jgi:hypothetical protein|nr:hypothetical protein [Paenibacillus sp.]
MTLWISICIIEAILLAGLIYSIVANQKRQRTRVDHNVNGTTSKHPILANPILLAYVLFPVAIVIGAALLYKFY